MATTYDANVKAALQAALPGRALTDADYAYWTNHGGVSAVNSTFKAPAPPPPPAPAPASYDFVVGGGAPSPAPAPKPAYDPAVKAALQAALPGRQLTDADYAYWTNHGGVSAVNSTFKPAPAPAPVSGGYQVTSRVNTIGAPGYNPALNAPTNKALSVDMSNPRVASFWGNVNPAKADGTNVLGGNMSQGVVQSLGFKTAQEFLDWQAENERKAALGDPNGFVTGGGRSRAGSPSPAPGAGAGAGSGAGGTGSGWIGGNNSSTQTTLTPGMSVEERAARIAGTDSPLMQQARGRAMQQMNERGLINSSLGIQAGQEAVLDRATDIAKADAQTEFQNSQNNANRSLQWKTAQLQAETSMKNAQLSAGTQLSVAEINRQYSQMANLSSTAASLMTAYNNDVNQIVLSDLPAEAKEAAINARTQTLRMSLNVMGSINGDVDMNNLLNNILG